MLLCSLFVADLIVGMEELELHYRSRGGYNFQKVKIATVSVRMVEVCSVDILVPCLRD